MSKKVYECIYCGTRIERESNIIECDSCGYGSIRALSARFE